MSTCTTDAAAALTSFQCISLPYILALINQLIQVHQTIEKLILIHNILSAHISGHYSYCWKHIEFAVQTKRTGKFCSWAKSRVQAVVFHLHQLCHQAHVMTALLPEEQQILLLENFLGQHSVHWGIYCFSWQFTINTDWTATKKKHGYTVPLKPFYPSVNLPLRKDIFATNSIC